MAQQSILGRIGQLARANINAMIDAAEDPEKMLDQMVRDYTNNIAEAEDAVAQTIGNLRMLEEDNEEALENAREWGVKALAASRKGDELRASGDTAGADRFDSLAKVALQRQLDAEGQVAAFEPQIAAQTEVVERLKTGLESMRGKLSELTAKRNELAARAKMAEAQTRVQRRGSQHRPHGSHHRGVPLRGEGPARGGPCGRTAGTPGVQPRRAVRGARGRGRTARGRSTAGGAEERHGTPRNRRPVDGP